MDSQQSFIATLRMFDHRVNFLEVLHGKPAMATIGSFSGGSFTGKPQTRDHSALLGILPSPQRGQDKPLRLHFRHTESGYVISIKNQGEYYNKIISQRWQEVMGAVDSNIDDPAAFTLVDPQNKPIKLENLTTPHSPVSLMTSKNKYIGGLRLKSSPYIYLAETEERSKITFILSI